MNVVAAERGDESVSTAIGYLTRLLGAAPIPRWELRWCLLAKGGAPWRCPRKSAS